MRTVFARLALGVAALAAAVVAVSPAVPAQAAGQTTVVPASSINDCKALYNSAHGYPLCFWADALEHNVMGHWYAQGPHWSLWREGECHKNGTWAQCASSIYNDSPTYVAVLWEGDGLHGAHRCLKPDAGFPDLTREYYHDSGDSMNDSIRSSSWVRYDDAAAVHKYCG